MDWSKGLSARYRAYIVDPVTWRDIDEIQIISGSISKSEDSLRESADIMVPDYNSETEQWIRVYLDARQNSDSYYGAIFTGIISSPSKDIEGSVKRNNLRCYSVLKPANDVLLPKGYYISYGGDSENILTNLLSCVRGIPIYTDGDFPVIPQTIIAEKGETCLSMADKILYSIGYRMYISGDGGIVITEPSEDPSAYFDPVDVDSLETKINLENNWFNCPNVFRAVNGNFSAVARDEDIDSPLSIANRGREIWVEETDCRPYVGESMEKYAERRLAELQNVSISASYSRRFDPNVNVSDIISLNYPSQDLEGLFYVSSQNIELGYSPTVSEVVYKL